MIVSYRTEIPLTDGRIVPVSRMKEEEAYTYIDGNFVPTKITITPMGEQRLHRLRTINGRVLDVFHTDTAIYNGTEEWLELDAIPHTARSTSKSLNRIELPIAELGFFPREGTKSKDPIWISMLRQSLFAQNEDIPAYLGELNHETLYALVYKAYMNSSTIQMKDVFARNRMFHLLARMGIHGKLSTTPVTNRRHLYLAGKGTQTFLKWHASRVHEFSDSFIIPAFKVTAELGSVMETNFLCRTTD